MINLLLSALFPNREGDDPGQPRGYTGRHRQPTERTSRDDVAPDPADWTADTGALVTEPA